MFSQLAACAIQNRAREREKDLNPQPEAGRVPGRELGSGRGSWHAPGALPAPIDGRCIPRGVTAACMIQAA